MRTDAGWRRLDARVLAVFPLRQAGALIPWLAITLIGGRHADGWQPLAAMAGPAVLVALGAVRWATVRYRVSTERVELRGGLLRRHERSLRRDRVRTVDVRASPPHRLFRLCVVEIGTGSNSGEEGRLTLDAVTREEADRLRRELLLCDDPRPDADAGPGGTELAELRLSWLRYAPLTPAGLVALGTLLGGGFKIASDAGIDLIGSTAEAAEELSATPAWLAVPALAAAVLVVSGLGSVAIYLEGWWRFRLSREQDGSLRLRRGLLTTRSLSLEQRRVRGVVIVEPLPLRLAGAARCTAITTGLDARSTGGGALLPAAPRAEAHRVAAAALLLDDPADGASAPLRRHPPAALRRAVVRAVLPALALAGVAWVASAWTASAWGASAWVPPLWPGALLLLPAAALLGLDRYRNLGHVLRPEYLVIGYGSVVRRRVALQRRGIIGWRIRQSPTQRWSGLVTLDPITAGGGAAHVVRDIPLADALALATAINPDVVRLGR
ncbi:PH domain-containing protein [Pseudonocardia eucalypti]|uniref:PH domain-containing protein n=1 Tax=Pseudonocardia eucalypti TaxID=648755 RepID=A0ABP9QC42_9PSEU|nr:putative membrane protein [Pseudonocardia eucalypti]